MRLRRLVTAAALVIATFGLTACNAPQVATTVPDIAAVQSTPAGAALKELGYKPVSIWFVDDAPKGHVFIDCGDDRNITECGEDRLNRATMDRPVLYVGNDGHIVIMQGPHVKSYDDRSHFMEVPMSHRDFAQLDPADRQALLSITPVVANAVGRQIDEDRYAVMTGIGVVHAWVDRYHP
jgi:hypothetical protein